MISLCSKYNNHAYVARTSRTPNPNYNLNRYYYTSHNVVVAKCTTKYKRVNSKIPIHNKLTINTRINELNRIIEK